MCQIVENYGNKRAIESERKKAMEIALGMIAKGKLSFEEIAEYTSLTLEEIKALAADKTA